MLLQFNFKNFKSFRDDTSLDMTATGMSEFNYRLINIGGEKILPVAAIFGANASGKSNIQEAFRFMSLYVISSFSYGDDTEIKGKSEQLFPTPFLLDNNSKNAETTFEVYFSASQKDRIRFYNYGFSIDKDSVVEEWLNDCAKTSRGNFKKVFYRKGNELDLSGIDEKLRENIRLSLSKEVLIVSLGAKLKIPKLKVIRDWFLFNDCVDFGKPSENFFLSRKLPRGFVDDEKVRNKVVDYFSSFDPSIIGFEVEEINEDTSKKKSKYRIDAIHRIMNSNKTVSIPLQQESAGTLKMFALYPLLQNALATGSVLFIDELNARLHPLLVRTFIITFLNPEINPNHAQLIFTSHDTWQLNNNLLRRDEIWFTEKSDCGVSTLYSLADFIDDGGSKIRKDENYEKNYLLGKYGAIPTMKFFDSFEEA